MLFQVIRDSSGVFLLLPISNSCIGLKEVLAQRAPRRSPSLEAVRAVAEILEERRPERRC